MRNVLTGLAALLAVQLVAAGVLLSGHRSAGEDGAPMPLLAGGGTGVDRIVITDGDDTATLVRAATGWELPDLGHMPANDAGVTAAIDRFAAIETDWPVAATASSHGRFQVAADNFQRRVQLFRGDETAADFYLGTSPGFRQVHLRRAGEDAVYVVELSVYDLPAGNGGWLDKALLAVGDPVAIEGPDYVIRQSPEGDWQFADVQQDGDGAAGETLDAGQARQLVAALAALRVLDVAEDGFPASGEAGSGPFVLVVESADGPRKFRFQVHDDHYYVERDDRDAVFTLSQYDYDRIVGFTRAKLAAGSAEPESGEAVTPEPAAE